MCLQCGNPYILSEEHGGHYAWCSVHCEAAHKHATVCKQCSTPLLQNGTLWCSYPCMLKACGLEELTCRNCNTAFVRTGEFKRVPKYCSQECRETYNAQLLAAMPEQGRSADIGHEVMLINAAELSERLPDPNPHYWRNGSVFDSARPLATATRFLASVEWWTETIRLVDTGKPLHTAWLLHYIDVQCMFNRTPWDPEYIYPFQLVLPLMPKDTRPIRSAWRKIAGNWRETYANPDITMFHHMAEMHNAYKERLPTGTKSDLRRVESARAVLHYHKAQHTYTDLNFLGIGKYQYLPYSTFGTDITPDTSAALWRMLSYTEGDTTMHDSMIWLRRCADKLLQLASHTS